MKRNEVFKSTYLAQADMPRPMVLTIADVRLEMLGQGADAEEKAVMHFTGDHKPMVCNNYNWTVCEGAFGEESDLWRGKQVEVYVDPSVMFGGKRVGGLRLRIPARGASNNSVPLGGPSTFWTWDQAIGECANAGITRDQMVAFLKARGLSAYNAARDTPAIVELISTQAGPGDGNGEEIPF